MKAYLTLFIFLVLTACGNDESTFVFRDGARPTYDRTVSIAEMNNLATQGAMIIDVRLQEDFVNNPELIKGASYRDPDAISEWAKGLPNDQPIIVYCVKGAWVSQKAATYLRELNLDVYSLSGGLNAWEKANISSLK
ncbi:MAG: hypothetical protein JKX72_00655 [Robiginitomaculum sp.]|nr:hypothetical protein [Robiginitomaculum sp.]